jgi:hypothetical protein
MLGDAHLSLLDSYGSHFSPGAQVLYVFIYVFLFPILFCEPSFGYSFAF